MDLTMATAAAILLGMNVTLWLASLVLGKTWPVDFLWSGYPPFLAILLAYTNNDGDCHRQIVCCVLTAVWGYRLTHNFVARGGIGHEDWRYTAMRKDFGTHFWWVSLFSVFIGQSVFMFTASLPLFESLSDPSPLGLSDALGGCVAVFAILLEAIADLQMDAFILKKQLKRTEDVVLSSGLWAWSRHPNYLGEICWWVSVWMFASPHAPRWMLICPGSIIFLFTAISIKLIEDRQLENKGDLYRSYIREVPSALLLVPPPLVRALRARSLYGSAHMQ